MQHLSPHYRSDDIDGFDQELKKYLDDNYIGNVPNRQRRNPKLVVLFSGGNAMGKTTLSNKISDELGGFVIENDAVKRQLLILKPGLDRDTLNKLTWQYTMDLYARLDTLTTNGLIVRDGVIDWYFDRIMPIFEQEGYEFFIIGFDITRKKAVELIKRRGDTPTVKEERFYAILDDHAVHTKRFREVHTPDIILKDDSVFDHDLVLSKLKQRLSSLKA